MNPNTFDVVAVSLKTKAVRVMYTKRDSQNAEAIVKLAVRSRGVNEEIFSVVPAGRYQDGDTWTGSGLS